MIIVFTVHEIPAVITDDAVRTVGVFGLTDFPNRITVRFIRDLGGFSVIISGDPGVCSFCVYLFLS